MIAVASRTGPDPATEPPPGALRLPYPPEVLAALADNVAMDGGADGFRLSLSARGWVGPGQDAVNVLFGEDYREVALYNPSSPEVGRAQELAYCLGATAVISADEQPEPEPGLIY